MHLFISGTDTDIGKTLISAWLCLQTGYAYFKPIQTGTSESRDASVVAALSDVTIHPEKFSYKAPLSPHLAAQLENAEIDLEHITLPEEKNLIIEGAGGLLVPINKKHFMIDLIQHLKIPVIIVASSRLGTINHTLLTLEALKTRQIQTLGVIMNGPLNHDNAEAIANYGNTEVLAEIPFLEVPNQDALKNIPLTASLKKILTN